MVDPKALLAKRRAARQFVVSHGGHDYTMSLPLPGEFEELADALAGRKVTPLRIVAFFGRGWSLTELDFDPGGTSVPVPFDPLLWSDWLTERPELVEAIFDDMSDRLEARRARLEVEQKN